MAKTLQQWKKELQVDFCDNCLVDPNTGKECFAKNVQTNT